MRWLSGPVRREEYFALAVWVNAGSSFHFSWFFLRVSPLYSDFLSSSFSDFDLMFSGGSVVRFGGALHSACYGSSSFALVNSDSAVRGVRCLVRGCTAHLRRILVNIHDVELC